MATWLDPESPGQATGSLQGIFSIGLFELGRHSLNVAGTFWLKSFALDHLPWLCWQAPLLCSHRVVNLSPSAQPFFAEVGIQLLWLSKADSVSVGVLQTCSGRLDQLRHPAFPASGMWSLAMSCLQISKIPLLHCILCWWVFCRCVCLHTVVPTEVGRSH